MFHIDTPGEGRVLIESVGHGPLDEGFSVSISQLCRWFGYARRTYYYYRPTKAAPKVRLDLERPIKALIEDKPSFGYRTVTGLLGMNKNTVQRIFQLRGWQVGKRAIGMRPRIQALPSVATRPDERWSTDLCRVWGGRDGWLTLALSWTVAPGRCWAGSCRDRARRPLQRQRSSRR